MYLRTSPVMMVSSVAMVLCMACAAYGSPAPSSSGSSDLLRAAAASSGGGESGLDGRGQREISASTFQHLLAVRSPKYNFGLGKRRYVIENAPGAKRLPQYNFGLGKRGRMDLFDYEEDSIPDWKDDYQTLLGNDIEEYDQDQDKSAEKRASGRYHFGLGKRRNYDFGLGKRSYQQGEKRLPNRYNFGLGRR
ncbi:hypothetical protein quinque_013133 [Culex quinquefasciatus]|uniref:helicostatins n=1 Tax=Culex quinquefasciatus TaxID=7176 RepID=UPI0018E3397C|nr:helicostatins [Culex quinquefasciatus]